MAFTGARVTVSSTAVALNTAGLGGHLLVIKNLDATNGVDLGGSGVTAGTGFPLVAGASVELTTIAGDVVFAIRSTANDVVVAVARVTG